MKPYVLFVVMLLITPVVGFVQHSERNTNAETSSVIISEIISEEDFYLTLRFDDCHYLHSEGCPALPYTTQTFTYPLGTTINSITVRPTNIETKTLSKKIAPAGLDVAANQYQELSQPAYEGQIYQLDAFYPPEWYTSNIGIGMVDGKRVVVVTIQLYPILYNPVADLIHYARDFEISIDHTPSLQTTLIENTIDLVIICPETWETTLQKLADHKRNHGIETMIETVESIITNYDGRDDAEKIKYYLKNAIEDQNISYVLLVGGRNGGLFAEKWWTPVRYAHIDDGGEGSFLSDLYFADIYKYEDGQPVFDDWDSNGNGVFAEWSGFRRDTVDYIPDLYVGRLPCRNEKEVADIVEKIITYENIDAENQDWFNRIVLVGGDSAPIEGDPYFEGEEENKVAEAYMTGFEPVKLWTSTGTLTGPQDVINEVSQGCGFLFFDGHGNPMGWSTHPPYDEETWIEGLSVSDMPELSNEAMYPVCVIGACHNGQFNVSILNFLKIWEISFPIENSRYFHYIWYGETAYECWAWRLTRLSAGGAIATLAYTGYDWFSVGDDDHNGIPDVVERISGYMNVHFFEAYGVLGKKILGEAHAGAIVSYIQNVGLEDPLDAKTVAEFELFGDPSLKIGGYGTS